MGIVILFSIVAAIVAIVGCATIWRFDQQRAEAVAHDRGRAKTQPVDPALPQA